MQFIEFPLRVRRPAGSSIDVLARARSPESQDLGTRLGAHPVVRRRTSPPPAVPWARRGNVAKATPDGYTMVIGFNGPLSIAPLLQKLPYDVQKDLAPVITTTSQPNVLAINAPLPVKTSPNSWRTPRPIPASSRTRRSATAARRISTANC